jgi:mono/diheme cytochrome c family protein
LICIKTADPLHGLARVISGGLMMPGKQALAPVVAGLSMLAAQGTAQEIGRPSEGRQRARQLCAECHAVEAWQDRSPNETAPRFVVIASVPGMTAIALSAMLNTSHRTMPNIMLTAEEQADIIAYILSLK